MDPHSVQVGASVRTKKLYGIFGLVGRVTVTGGTRSAVSSVPSASDSERRNFAPSQRNK